MGRNRQHVQVVDPLEFRRDLLRRTRHPRQQQISLEEALVRHLRQGLALPRHLHPFLGLDHLVQTPFPGAIGHHPAGVLIDDLHLVRLGFLVVGDDVVLVLVEGVQRRQCFLHQFVPPYGRAPDAALSGGEGLQFLLPGRVQPDLAVMGDLIVGTGLQTAGVVQSLLVQRLAHVVGQ